MFKRIAFGIVLMLAVPSALIVAAPASEAAAPSIPLLTDVQVQDMGSFDRVTFVFSGPVAPGILQAEYIQGPAILSPKGEPVQPPIAGAARILITMSPASSFDLSVIPVVPTYTGPTRFAPNLPSVVELMQVQDFEATLQWVIGVRNLGLTATAQAFAGPGRIEVDVPHGGTPAVTLAPSFTG
jgi:hypothetical protein